MAILIVYCVCVLSRRLHCTDIRRTCTRALYRQCGSVHYGQKPLLSKLSWAYISVRDWWTIKQANPCVTVTEEQRELWVGRGQGEEVHPTSYSFFLCASFVLNQEDN